jgi:CRP/FNR family cyclic AMP-dependent transcriptional regulator
MTTRIELLQAMALFGGVRDDILGFLLGLSATRSLAEGEFFFREDDQAESLFVLEAGQVAVVKNWAGHDYVLSRLARGDCFGEMSLMDLRHRSASVVALAPCRALELPIAGLHALFDKDLEQFTLIQMNMGREVSRRLRDADERLFRARVGSDEVLAEYVFRSA